MRKRLGIGPLAIRHALLAALLGVSLGAAFSLLQVSADYRRSVEAERQEILQMMAVMREPAAQACYNLNVQAAKVIVQGVLSYVPVQQATLVSDFGDALAEGRNDAIGQTAAGAWWARFIPPTQSYSLALEFGPGRQRVGELRVVTAQASRVERFLQRALRDVGLNLLRSVTVALALGLLSFVTLTRPLTAIARRIGHGPSDRPEAVPLAEARRADEIGQIASAFQRYEQEASERAQRLEASAKALAASEVRYRRIVETAGEGVWQVDSEGRTTLANEAMARMLGSTPEQLLGRSLFDFVDAADQDRARALLVGCQAREAERLDVRFRRADGQVLWAEISTCPVAGDEGTVIGTLAMVTNATERRRRDEELRATNARLTMMVEDLERHKTDMAQIAELNELLQSARTEPEAFEVIRAAASRLFADRPGGFAVSGQGEEMRVVGTWGEPAGLPARYPRSACWAIRRGGPHLQVAPEGVGCSHHEGLPAAAVLCTPLYVEGELIGVLHLHSTQGPEGLAGVVLQRLEVFGEVVKLGLSNLRLRDTLREQALCDPLTGLPNRRLFDETLPRELARCLRADQPLTLAVVDLDHFKRINDTHGHEGGDQVLCAVARALQKSIRAGDMACRYGGDEFMCLLPGMGAQDATACFERALQRVAAELVGSALGDEPVTFTVGLAAAPASGGDVATLKLAADAALYLAKERGRSRVQVAPPTLC